MVIYGRSRGGDERAHILPLTGYYKGIFVQVLELVLFYKSEKINAFVKSTFCKYVHF